MQKIEFVEKDQIWQNEQTNYWFNVDGESYAVADQNGNLSLLDSEGYPIAGHGNFVNPRYENLLSDLKPHYEAHIED